MDFGIASVAAITVICYLVGLIVKASGLDNKYIPSHCGPVWRVSWRGGSLPGAARLPSHRPADGGRCWHCERPCGHWRKSGSKTAFQQVITFKV